MGTDSLDDDVDNSCGDGDINNNDGNDKHDSDDDSGYNNMFSYYSEDIRRQ